MKEGDDERNCAAFLRGINVGRHRRIKMEDLRKMFSSMGFKNVKTYLASGNILFQTTEKNLSTLEQKIETKLEEIFGYQISVILRSVDHLRKMLESKPFYRYR